jgi:hypothetical protein
MLNKEKALSLLRRDHGLFYFHPSAQQAGVGLKTKKPWCFCTKASDL